MQMRFRDTDTAAALLAASLTMLASACKPPAREISAATPSSDGIAIHYRVEGAGEPALVFVHCWSCDSTYWDAQVKEFAPRHRVAVIDLAGHGASGLGRAAWTIEAFARDVQAVVEHLNLRRVILVGHSMGGPVALEAARAMPERVIGLVPVDTLHDADWDAEQSGLGALIDSMGNNFPVMADLFVRSMFLPDADPALVDRIAEDMAAAPPEVAIGALRTALTYDPRPSLQTLRVPIRALTSEKFPLKLEVNRRYAPQFESVIVPGTGHFPMLERPQEFNRLLGEAIARIAAAPASPARRGPSRPRAVEPGRMTSAS